MRKIHWSALLAAGLLFFVLWSSPAHAGNTAQQGVSSLSGLKGVGLVIEDIDPAIEREGFTALQIQKDMEEKLRAAGIKILSEAELTKSPGMPYLYVNIFTFKDEDIYAYHITLELKQMVSLVRKPSVKQSVATWKISGGGTVGAQKLPTIRTTVGEYINAFIKAYFAANPKTP
jgi:hypothetical protein